MSKKTISGTVVAIEPNSAGIDTVYVKPLDGALTNYMTGAPSPRRGGPQIGQTIEALVIPGNLERSYTFVDFKVLPKEELWKDAKPADNVQPTGETKAFTAEDKQAAKARREAHKAQRLAEMAKAESLAAAVATAETPVAEPAPAA